MLKKTLFSLAAATGLMTAAVPASAQQNGLVNVNVDDIQVLNDSVNNNNVQLLNNLLRDAQLLNNLNVLNAFNIQVPIGIAATVCGVSAAVLGAAGSGAACHAENASPAFGNAVLRALQDNRGRITPVTTP